MPPISAQQKPTIANPDIAAARGEAGSAIAESAAKLPVRRVVLYKNGVGYFEHLGRVRGSQDVHIDFTSAQLNDVLKSLTVLDLAGGRITASTTTPKRRWLGGSPPCASLWERSLAYRNFLEHCAARELQCGEQALSR